MAIERIEPGRGGCTHIECCQQAVAGAVGVAAQIERIGMRCDVARDQLAVALEAARGEDHGRRPDFYWAVRIKGEGAYHGAVFS